MAAAGGGRNALDIELRRRIAFAGHHAPHRTPARRRMPGMAISPRDAVIVDGLRTPVGRLRGALGSVRPDDLGGHAIRSLLARTGASASKDIDEVIFGCANQAGEDNRNVARMALLLAGLPDEVPGFT